MILYFLEYIYILDCINDINYLLNEGNDMSKSFDIIMAGLISGIVALTTSFLGLAGTVIGAVLGAILYQVLSIFVKEPLESTTIRKVENGLVFTIPLILIAIFLAVFIIALLHSYLIYYPDFLDFFIQLETLTNNNLVRFMGIGLILMGIYPLLQPRVIKKEYGIILFILGIILLGRGLLDLNPEFFYMYTDIFELFDVVLVICIFLVLIFIIIKIFLESISLYMKRNNGLNILNSNKIGNRNDSANIYNNENIDYKSIKYKYTNYDNMDYDDYNNEEDSNTENDSSKNKNLNNDFNEFGDSKDFKSSKNKEHEFKTSNNNLTGKTIKSSKTSTMSKNRKYFKR